MPTPTPDRPLLVHGGRVFTADPDRPWAEAVVVSGDRISFVGGYDDAASAAGSDAVRLHVAGGLVLPGFVDGHVHIGLTGEALGQAQLRDATDLDLICERLLAWRSERPDVSRVVGTGWVHGSVPNATPTKEMLDDAFPDVAVYLHAYDYHSCWLNSVALREIGITDETPDPVGGTIVRDPMTGEATGWLLEAAAALFVWPALAADGPEERREHQRLALDAYARNGITTAVDMGMDADGLADLARLDERGELTARVVAHMRVRRTGDLATELDQVAQAAELARRHTGDRLTVVGIKIVADGTIDACTAAMLEPYVTGTNTGPIWDVEPMNAVVEAADAAGLQVAIHAIGDRTIRIAIDALVRAAEINGSSGRRHRIEHLESTDPADIGRLAAAGITASMQPVHCDPEILPNWMAMLGPERAQRGFAWPLYLEDDGRLVFGTDTPTAPLEPLPNMYIAATRRSPAVPSLAPHRPDWALPMELAISCATRESAWASHLDAVTGVLREGMAADLVVVDRDVVADGPDSLLDATVTTTIVGGRIVHGDDPR